jgi:hypothetical protein
MHQSGVTRRWRWLTLAGLGLAFAVVSPLLTSATGAGARASSGPLAASGYITSGPARIIAAHPARIATPARPSGVQINRPAMPMAQYRAMKAAAAKAGGAKPSQPGSPLSTNVIAGQAPLTVEGGPGGSWYPPDVNGAPGRSAPFSNQLTEITNSKISVYSKSPSAPALLSEISLNTRFGYATQPLFDPRIEYDARWNRWVAVADAFPETSGTQHFFLGISSTSDATGSWIIYNLVLPVGAGGFVDYPQLSLTQDAVVITYSDFATAGQSCLTLGIAKAAVYNAQGFSTFVFNLGGNCTVTPPNVIDPNPRAHELLWQAGIGAYNVEFRNPQGMLYSGINGISPVPVSSAAVPPNAPQPAAPACTAPSCNIDTLDGRFVNDPTQYGDDLWAVHTPGFGTFPIPAWYDYDVEGAGANTAKQSGLQFFSGSSFDWNASIAAQSDGRAYMQWSYDDPGPGVYPSMAFTGRLATDPVNTMNATTSIFTGANKLMGNYDSNFGAQRWGDTSSIRFDPSVFVRAYALNESVPNSAFWGTQQAAVAVTP